MPLLLHLGPNFITDRDLYSSYVNLIYMYFLLSSQLVLYTENMFYHLTQLVEDRDNCIGVSILYSGGLW